MYICRFLIMAMMMVVVILAKIEIMMAMLGLGGIGYIIAGDDIEKDNYIIERSS